MRFTLEIRLSNSEGALERVLGKLRQRDFGLCGIVADCSTDRATINARIMVESARPVEPALKQLGKLYDVQHLKVHHAEAESNNGYTNGYRESQAELCLSV